MTFLRKFLLLTPVFGIIVFIALYVISAALYPGGSYAEPEAAGFSWKHNYWCNLLSEKAINGLANPGKPVALTATVILGVSLTLFWFLVSTYIIAGRKPAVAVRVSGSVAMVSTIFLGSSMDHDLVVNLASAAGVIAVTGTIIGLYQKKWFWLFALGLLNMLLVGLNNYAYYGNAPVVYLPVVQKISFVSFLIWMLMINLCIYSGQVRSFRNPVAKKPARKANPGNAIDHP